MQSSIQPSQHSAAEGKTSSLKRAMTKRHLIMLSLGGAIDTGLFLNEAQF
jgi:S-methylmethionine transporter